MLFSCNTFSTLTVAVSLSNWSRLPTRFYPFLSPVLFTMRGEHSNCKRQERVSEGRQQQKPCSFNSTKFQFLFSNTLLGQEKKGLKKKGFALQRTVPFLPAILGKKKGWKLGNKSEKKSYWDCLFTWPKRDRRQSVFLNRQAQLIGSAPAKACRTYLLYSCQGGIVFIVFPLIAPILLNRLIAACGLNLFCYCSEMARSQEARRFDTVTGGVCFH